MLTVTGSNVQPLSLKSVPTEKFQIDACFSSHDEAVIEHDARGLAPTASKNGAGGIARLGSSLSRLSPHHGVGDIASRGNWTFVPRIKFRSYLN